MPARFVTIDRDTPMLLPPDLRDWVAQDHLVHFIIDAVGLLDLSEARVNHRGTGSEQYPPSMMLGLLIYSATIGPFGEQARGIAFQFRCGCAPVCHCRAEDLCCNGERYVVRIGHGG